MLVEEHAAEFFHRFALAVGEDVNASLAPVDRPDGVSERRNGMIRVADPHDVDAGWVIEAEDVSLAKITGPGFDEHGIVDAVETVTTVYENERQDGERFVDTFRRIGMNPFKEALYG